MYITTDQSYDIDEIITRMPTPEQITKLGISPGTPVAEHPQQLHRRADWRVAGRSTGVWCASAAVGRESGVTRRIHGITAT